MTWYIVIAVSVAVGLPLIAIAMERYPRLYCALHGHDAKCSVEQCGVFRWTCRNCHREVGQQ